MVKPGPRRRGLKASPERGAGSRLGRLPERSSPVLRLSSPVSCPSSLVSRPKVGNPMGAEPSWSSGRESRGDRLEIGPLWRFLFPISFPLKEIGSRRSAKSPRPVPVFRPRRSGQSSVSLRIRRLPLRFVLPSRRLRRPSSEHTSLAPFPQNRNTAKTTYRSVAPPHSAREGTRRKAVGVRSFWKRSCAVFRRIRTRPRPP